VLRYVLLRLVLIPVGAVGVATLSFFFVNLIPSDPVRALLGDFATPGAVAEKRHALGLDQSLWVRYANYLDQIAHGNLGKSYYGGSSVGHEIVIRLTSSLELIILGFAVAWLIGVVLGGLSAYRRGRLVDRLGGTMVSVMQAIPDYAAAVVGLYVFFFLLGWLPAPVGQADLTAPVPPNHTGSVFVDNMIIGSWVNAGSALLHLVLPVLALGMANSVVFARLTRVTLARALESPYSEFGRAQGLTSWQIVRQGFRASKVSLLTYAAKVVAGLLGGDAIVEEVFNWHGVGQWAVTGLLNSDLPVIQGFVLLSGIVTLLAYICSDFLILRADPRIRRPYQPEVP
jgi:peptide/nickel transport system permease protein